MHEEPRGVAAGVDRADARAVPGGAPRVAAAAREHPLLLLLVPVARAVDDEDAAAVAVGAAAMGGDDLVELLAVVEGVVGPLLERKALVVVAHLEEVVRLDQSTFPTDTYLVEGREDGSLVGEVWYEKTPQMLKMWGLTGLVVGYYVTLQFSDGLVVTWYPMGVGDHEESFATVWAQGAQHNVSLTVDVLAEEPVVLSFGTLVAHKVRYQIRVWSPYIDATDTWYEWLVPYLGRVKYEDDEGYLEKLTSFGIGCGTITQETDADDDGLKDYEELIIYNTNWQEADTDQDGMPDGWEVTYGLNPLVDDASQDSDGDGFSNLMEYLRGTDPSDPNSHPSMAMPWIPLLLLGD